MHEYKFDVEKRPFFYVGEDANGDSNDNNDNKPINYDDYDPH